MLFLETAAKTLLILGVLFFGVFSYIFLLWTERKKGELRNIIGAAVISLLYTFKVLLFSFLIILILHLGLEIAFDIL